MGWFVYCTFITVSDGVKVDIVLVVADEEQAEPGVERIDWHDEKNANDVALLVRDCVGPQVCVDLEKGHRNKTKIVIKKKPRALTRQKCIELFKSQFQPLDQPL